MNPKNKCIPFELFGHPPCDLSKYLENAGIMSAYNKLVLYELFCLVDFDETENIDDIDPYNGFTCIISLQGLANRTGLSRSSVVRAIKSLADAKLIERETHETNGVKTANRYKILIYNQALQNIKDNPGHPKRNVVTLVATEETDNQRKQEVHSEHRFRENKAAGSESTKGRFRENHIQESFQEFKDPPGSGNSTGKEGTTPPEDGGIKNRLKAEDVDKEKTDGQGKDFVPNHQIGEMLDALTQSKTSGALGTENGRGRPELTVQTDETIESFVKALKPDEIIVTWKDRQAANLLKEKIEGLLSAALINMPPLLFFKYMVKEMDERVEDGKIRVRPTSLNFLLKAATGKDIMECCLDKISSGQKASRSKDKTQAWLQEVREERKSNCGKIPEKTQTELDRLLGRSVEEEEGEEAREKVRGGESEPDKAYD